jgi:hypothetical protein
MNIVGLWSLIAFLIIAWSPDGWRGDIRKGGRCGSVGNLAVG